MFAGCVGQGRCVFQKKACVAYAAAYTSIMTNMTNTETEITSLVTLSRDDLVRNCACGAGLALFDRWAPSESLSVEWTPLHSIWLAARHGTFAAWLVGAGLIPHADLSDANLSGAHLSDANLSGANMIGANLRGANLSGADMSHADLSGANMSGADLRGANLSGADMYEANLIGAKVAEVFGCAAHS